MTSSLTPLGRMTLDGRTSLTSSFIMGPVGGIRRQISRSSASSSPASHLGVDPPSFGDLVRAMEMEHDREVEDLHGQLEELQEAMVELQESVRRKAAGDSDSLHDSLPDGREDFAGNGPASARGSRKFDSGRGGSGRFDRNTSSGSLRVKSAFTIENLPAGMSETARVVQRFLKATNLSGGSAEALHSWVDWWMSTSEPARSGCLHAIIRNKWFQGTCLGMIMLNGLSMIFTTDYDMELAISGRETWADHFIAVEIFFTIFYTVEMLLKLSVHRLYFFIHRLDWRWNLLDFALVLFSVSDTLLTLVFLQASGELPNLNFVRTMRILKVARVFRMMRAVRFFQELRLMLDCVLGSFMALIWCLTLIVFVLYLFSLVFVQGLAGYMVDLKRQPHGMDDAVEAEIIQRFGSTLKGMLGLFEATTGGQDWNESYKIVELIHPFYGATYLFFIAFFVIAAWNIVTSTFVEKALKLAVPDIESLVLEKREQDQETAKELTQLIKRTVDEDGDGRISLEEFEKHFANSAFKDFFAVRGIDFKDASAFFHMLSSVSDDVVGEVDIDTFVGGCIRLQGFASSIELQVMHYEMRSVFQGHAELLQTLKAAIDGLRSQPKVKGLDSTGLPVPSAYL